MPSAFAEGQVWLRETDEGWDWITRHLAENINAYAALTAEALKELQSRLPAASTLLEPVLPSHPRAREDARAASRL